MELHRIPHPDNFGFVQRLERREKQGSKRHGSRPKRSSDEEYNALTESEGVVMSVRAVGHDVFHWTARDRRWEPTLRLHSLAPELEGESDFKLQLTAKGSFTLSRKGRRRSSSSSDEPEPRPPRLRGSQQGFAGLNGRAWMLQFALEPGDRFFGMGEKWGPLEKSRQHAHFHNTDVWADYSAEKVWFSDVDATYASIPYLIIERAGSFFGILLDTPHRAFMNTGRPFSLWGDSPVGGQRGPDSATSFSVGAVDGAPSVYFLVGPTLRELTSKLQRLIGTTPRPPLWALGHHQSRWGYASTQDLVDLDARFTDTKTPNDGLWLDIDYMDGFRVFTTGRGAVSSAALNQLTAKRRRVVPILDPGVKVEPGFEVDEEGLAGGHFCLAPSGKPYVGVVWPGRTHFPDFSQQHTRLWWAERVARFASLGFAGFWIDMNDPSTGPVENDSMLFSGGKLPHAAFRNQYALGMAQATQAGLLKARPDSRPFVLTRSASTGIARYAAMWTGDNVSNEHHLRRAIAVSLNLALSGVPFNGPDVPGFGHDATDELAERFYQTAFLFPFLRNHSVHDCRAQEPWRFSQTTRRIIRNLIRLRYRFLPHLYQLFIQQEASGTPLIAPCFLDNTSDTPPREDQFLLGPDLLVAPPVESGKERSVCLPEGWWYSLNEGSWLRGGRTVQLALVRGQPPLFVRSGTLLPLAKESSLDPEDGGAPLAERLLADLEIHAFLRPGEEGRLTYLRDDGESFAYRRGEEGSTRFHAERARSRVRLQVEGPTPSDWGVNWTLLLHGAPPTARVCVEGELRKCTRQTVRLSGSALSVLSVPE